MPRFLQFSLFQRDVYRRKMRFFFPADFCIRSPLTLNPIFLDISFFDCSISVWIIPYSIENMVGVFLFSIDSIGVLINSLVLSIITAWMTCSYIAFVVCLYVVCFSSSSPSKLIDDHIRCCCSHPGSVNQCVSYFILTPKVVLLFFFQIHFTLLDISPCLLDKENVSFQTIQPLYFYRPCSSKFYVNKNWFPITFSSL